MAIKRIKVTNFKSFRDVEIVLGDLNVIIGTNASGKSNLITIFRFLKDIATYGLDNAISMQGGVQYVRNINVGDSIPFSLEVVLDEESNMILTGNSAKSIGMVANEIIYNLSISFKGKRFHVSSDRLTLRGDIVERSRSPEQNPKQTKNSERVEIIISNNNGKLDFEERLPEGTTAKDFFLLAQQYTNRRESRISKALLLTHPLVQLLLPSLDQFFGSIAIYDFEPKLPKKAVSISGKNELESDGSNLAIVLKNILENTREKKIFIDLVRGILPFVNNINIEELADKSLMFNFKESYTKKQSLPATLMSDGTVNIISLILALYFEQNSIAIVEEPERNVHPRLIAYVAELLKGASNEKQVIATTHNPQLIKYFDISNLLLVSRDSEGFSTVSKPADKENVKVFLKNNIGLDDLYIQDLLRA